MNNKCSLLINKGSSLRNSNLCLTAETQCNSRTFTFYALSKARHGCLTVCLMVYVVSDVIQVLYFASDIRLERLVSGYYAFHATINLAIYIQITDDRSINSASVNRHEK
jgi:hypothetical protein